MRGSISVFQRGQRWMKTETCVPRSPERDSGKQCCWLRDPVRPCVFWVITGFGIHSAGRGHAVETNVLEPAPSLGPDTPPPFLHRPHRSRPVSVLSHLLHRLQCVFQHVRAKPLPLRNSLCLLILSFPLFFSLPLGRLVFCIVVLFDTPGAPPPSHTPLCYSAVTQWTSMPASLGK